VRARLAQLAGVADAPIAWLRGRTGWQAGLVCALAGAGGVLGHAPFFVWPAYALAIVVLYLSINATAGPGFTLARGLRAAAWRGWAFAFGHFLAGMSWVGNAFLVDADRFAALMPVAVTALPAGLGLFWAAGAMLVRALYRPGAGRALVFAGVFGLVELARGHLLTGLPWNLPAYIWEPSGWVAQSGSLIGAYGVSGLTLLAFTAPLMARSGRLGRLVALSPLLLALGAVAVGVWRDTGRGLTDYATQSAPAPLTVAAGQAGFSQREVWDPANRERIVEAYLALLADPAVRDADVIVWPESAMPLLLLEEPDIAPRIDALLGGRTLILGSLRRDVTPDADGVLTQRYFNSLLVLSRRTGSIGLEALYDKHHLVPFGEYLPLQPLFSALGLESLVSVGGSITPGPAPAVLEAPGLPPFDPRVCYEIIFPSYNLAATGRAKWIVNVSVDAWYGDGLGPDQHFAQAAWRALETGLPVVRAASGGWSAIIDPYGRILSKHRIGAGYALASLPPSTDTLFSKSSLPPLIIFALLFFVVAGFFMGTAKQH
jgi:apolipoprotein N-acyltransferase